MATYIITTKSTLYTVYAVYADTEAEALEIVETTEGLCEMGSWTEDTETRYVEKKNYEETN